MDLSTWDMALGLHEYMNYTSRLAHFEIEKIICIFISIVIVIDVFSIS